MNRQDFQESAIPETLYALSSLEMLSLSMNSIKGTISPSISKLTNLSIFDLSRNLLFGEIPASLEPLANNMRNFRLYHNVLSGTIPTSVMSFGLADGILLQGNMLTGTIPNTIGQLTYLQRLEVQGNLLTGRIPSELATLVYLTTFHAFNNRLSAEENPLCSSEQTFESLSMDCDQVHCPCCTNCCLPTNSGAFMCTTIVCEVCSGDFLVPIGCTAVEGVDDKWREKAMSCDCVCIR